MKYKDKQDQNKITKEISKDTILEYLSENPDFIIKNVDLLNKMFVLKKNNTNVISFEDIRIKSLIDENNLLKKKLAEIIETAKINKNIQEKISKFSNEIISYRNIASLFEYIEKFIENEFSSISIKIYMINFSGFSELDKKYFSSESEIKNLINDIYLDKKPCLVTQKIVKKYSLEKHINKSNSYVLCPLGIEYPVGIIFVKQKSEMMGIDLQFDLLESLAVTISYSLEQYIQN